MAYGVNRVLTILATCIGLATTCSANLALTSIAVRDDPDPEFYLYADSVPGEYIVRFDDGTPEDDSLLNQPGTTGGGSGIPPSCWTPPGPGGSGNQPAIDEANSICTQYGGTILEVYDYVASFRASMTEAQARAMSHDPRVLCVTSNVNCYADGDETLTDPGQFTLDRSDQRDLPLDGHFHYTNTGAGVHAYDVDTGTWPGHTEFQTNGVSRVSLDYKAIGSTFDDTNGHGTEVCSLIGGNICGIAKNVSIHSVKCLDGPYNSTSSGSIGQILSGLNWIYVHRLRPTVVNMSLSCSTPGLHWILTTNGPEFIVPAVEEAVWRIIRSGAPVCCSAGNSNRNAIFTAPQDLPQAICVGSIDSADEKSSFSCFGEIVDLFAPGDSDYIAFFSQDPKTAIFVHGLGTSYSSPLAAGVVAQYLQTHTTASPADIQTWLINNATTGHIQSWSLPAGTPNRILFTNL